MRICVFGAGAVGGHFAAKLAAAGHDVSVVARGANLDAMRDRGITLIHGDQVISGKVRTRDPGLQDFVFVTLKANALGAFADAAAPLLGPRTAVVFAQNGIPWWYAIGLSRERRAPPDLSRLDPGGRLKNLLTKEQIVGGVVYSANEVREPGVIVNNVPGNNMLVLGQADDSDSAAVRELRAILNGADLSSPPTADIRTSVWGKLVQNLATAPLCTLAGTTVLAVRNDEALKNLAARIAAEGRAIALAHGVDPAKAPTRPTPVGGGISHKPSLLQDYERNRPMEIEALLAAPLAFARIAGVPVPTLETVAALVTFKAAEKGLYGD